MCVLINVDSIIPNNLVEINSILTSVTKLWQGYIDIHLATLTVLNLISSHRKKHLSVEGTHLLAAIANWRTK